MADDDAPQPVFSDNEERVYGRSPGAGDWKRYTRITLLVILVVYAVLFFLFNRETVTVTLVVAEVSIPLVWVLMLSFVLGALVMYLLLFLRRRAARKGRDA